MEECLSQLRNQTEKLLYNRNEGQQLLIHVEAFIASLREKSDTQDLIDLQAALSEALTDLLDVLTDILKSPRLKQIIWRDGISSLISGVYRIINGPSFNTSAEHDSIRRARDLDVDRFHEMIQTTRSSQILERLGVPTNQHLKASIALHQHVKKFVDGNHLECQFIRCAIENLPEGHATPDDSFSITEFDVVIHRNRILGKGGFGEVFEGNWRGTKVAIKRIAYFHPALGANEINILKSLKHDHIVQIFGANPDPFQPFLVCALMSEGDVSKFLLKNPSANRRKLSYEASLGLAYLHENSVIHGDLKPTNILVDENGTSCLCDFGLSRIRTHLTQPPTSPLGDEPPAGTIYYMSPEQMKYGITNEKTDIYSFGMTIYEIFSDTPPFKDVNGWSLLRKDVVDFADRPSKPQRQADIDRGLDDELWNLIVDCWSQEPSKRPMTPTVSSALGRLNNCAIKPTPSTAPAAGKAEMSSHHLTTFLSPPTQPWADQSDESDITKVERNTPFMSQSAGKMSSKKNCPIMILLMGEIGAGKSTFINTATAETLSTVGHDLEPCTSTIQGFVFDRHGRDVIFVDTPGFNHPTKTDRAILEEIVNWLEDKYRQDTDTRLGGIIFLYDLSQPRDVSRGKNVMTPVKLSNPAISPLVMIATVGGNNENAKHREKQLKTTNWQKLQICQFTNTSDSAWNLVDTLLGRPPIEICHIQRELDKICKELPQQLPRRKGTFLNFFARLFGLK